MSVYVFDSVSQSKWRDLQPLDREEQKESTERNALLSKSLQAGALHT